MMKNKGFGKACLNHKKASLASGIRNLELPRAFGVLSLSEGEKVVVFSIDVSGAAILLNPWIKVR